MKPATLPPVTPTPAAPVSSAPPKLIMPSPDQALHNLAMLADAVALDGNQRRLANASLEVIRALVESVARPKQAKRKG